MLGSRKAIAFALHFASLLSIPGFKPQVRENEEVFSSGIAKSLWNTNHVALRNR